MHFDRKPIITKGHNLNASKIVDILVTKPFRQAKFLYLCPPGRFWTFEKRWHFKEKNMFIWYQLELLLVMLSIRMYKCRKIILNTNISRHKVNVHPGDLQFLQHLMESHRFYLHFNRKPIKTKGHNLNATKNCNLQVTKPFHQARFL